MNPQFERIQPEFGTSFTLKKFYQSAPNYKPSWHYHPELELVYVENGSGKIHVGRHLSYFKNGCLVLIGSNLPHLGFVERLTANEIEIVAQFKLDFLGPQFFDAPEMLKVKQMLKLSLSGIKFSRHVRREVGGKLLELVEMDNFNKLLYFMRILNQLSEYDDFEILNVGEATMVSNPQDNDRLDEIFKYVRNNFNLDIQLKEISKIVNMTPPSFCRYFKKATNVTFTEYVNKFKVVHATKLMSETNLSITEIADESGFNNKSHFIKQFKKITSQKPSEYRAGLIQAFG
ncbi:MAG: helix-turn-helix transcriptional regulator [Saprospiraceae bacterium]|nr:AraC family transcriptional regulator [Bacteroidia bacterium]NNE15094.1 helix-turn-helix transcriptional regulator [Saprospiraceae bacterium]NNL93838.1 helix-turn-helix transcriptional regulator [Saprospiraceae bacterium]